MVTKISYKYFGIFKLDELIDSRHFFDTPCINGGGGGFIHIFVFTANGNHYSDQVLYILKNQPTVTENRPPPQVFCFSYMYNADNWLLNFPVRYWGRA